MDGARNLTDGRTLKTWEGGDPQGFPVVPLDENDPERAVLAFLAKVPPAEQAIFTRGLRAAFAADLREALASYAGMATWPGAGCGTSTCPGSAPPSFCGTAPRTG